MAGNDGFNSGFDAALDEILPDDLEESVQQTASNADHATPAGALIRQQYSLTRGVSTGQRDKIAKTEIESLVTELNAPAAVRETATSLFTQYAGAVNQPFFIELYAAAALYCACKVSEVPISPSEVTDVGEEQLSPKVLLRRSKHIASTLGLDASAFIEPTQYIDRYCEELSLSESIHQRAKEVIGIAADAGLTSGKSPRGLAAAAIYNAALEHGSSVNQGEIADVAGVSEVTVRNRYQEQREQLN